MNRQGPAKARRIRGRFGTFHGEGHCQAVGRRCQKRKTNPIGGSTHVLYKMRRSNAGRREVPYPSYAQKLFRKKRAKTAESGRDGNISMKGMLS